MGFEGSKAWYHNTANSLLKEICVTSFVYWLNILNIIEYRIWKLWGVAMIWDANCTEVHPRWCWLHFYGENINVIPEQPTFFCKECLMKQKIIENESEIDRFSTHTHTHTKEIPGRLERQVSIIMDIDVIGCVTSCLLDKRRNTISRTVQWDTRCGSLIDDHCKSKGWECAMESFCVGSKWSGRPIGMKWCGVGRYHIDGRSDDRGHCSRDMMSDEISEVWAMMCCINIWHWNSMCKYIVIRMRK